MGRIRIIFTGGTIGSTLQRKTAECPWRIATDTAIPRMLLKVYEAQFGKTTDYFEPAEPYTILSENQTGKTIGQLIEQVRADLAGVSGPFDGIIVTHGTDTLQYTAAALAYAVGLCPIPVVLVSANYPIEDAASNGVCNLHGAVRWIHDRPRKLGGVWVSYQNPGEPLRIHRATRLLAHPTASDFLYSLQNAWCGMYDADWQLHLNPAYTEQEDELAPLWPSFVISALSNPGILRIEPYPGMRYPEIPQEIQGILHGSFHAGTINTESEEARRFFEEAFRRKISVFLTGTTGGIPYESTKYFEAFHLTPLPDRAPIAMYMKLWLCLFAGQKPEDVMPAALGGDH